MECDTVDCPPVGGCCCLRSYNVGLDYLSSRWHANGPVQRVQIFLAIVELLVGLGSEFSEKGW